MSKTHPLKFIFYSTVILFSLFLVSCSSGIEVISDRSDNPVLVNGERSDWVGNLVQSDDRKMAFGFRNDSKFLYILVTTPDRATAMKMLMQGLTIKVKGNEGEELGIRYPLKPLPEDLREIRGMEKREEQPDLEGFVRRLKKFNDQIQVVTKDDYPIYTADASKGRYLRGSFGMSAGQFVLELQIPLTGDDIAERLFPVYPKEISVKMESGSVDREGIRPGGGMGDEGGMGKGRGGGRGGHGGGAGGRDRPGRGGDRPDFSPIKASFKVKIQ